MPGSAPNSSARRAAFGANFGEKFSLLPRQLVPLSTDLFATDGPATSFPCPPTASKAGMAGSNHASRCVRIGPEDDGPVLGIPANALGRDLFRSSSPHERMRYAGQRSFREARSPDLASLIRATEAAYSAASLTYLAVGVRIVTSSSAAVGCSAIVASKSALVAFIFTAMATAWTISAAVSPTM